MLGGGCGEQLALWIINGRPDLHMYSYDVRRFTLEQMQDVAWAKERSHESYATNYATVFPNDQFLAGRNFQTGPFHEVNIFSSLLHYNYFSYFYRNYLMLIAFLKKYRDGKDLGGSLNRDRM